MRSKLLPGIPHIHKYVRRQIFCLMKKRISNAQRIRIAHTSRRTEDARCKSKECEKKQRCGKREHKKGRESVRERTVCKRYGKSSKQQTTTTAPTTEARQSMTQPLTKQKENNNNNNNKSSSRKSRNMSTKALGGLQGYTVRGEGRTAGEGVPGVGSSERAGWIDSTTSPQSFLWRVQVRQSKKFAALPPYFAFAFIGQHRRLATCHTINSN